MAKSKCKWVYRVENHLYPRKMSEHTNKAEAFKRARKRAEREYGQVGVAKACLKPGDILSYNEPGTGIIWRSEWRSRG